MTLQFFKVPAHRQVEKALQWLDNEGVAEWDEVVKDVAGLVQALELKPKEEARLRRVVGLHPLDFVV